MSNSAPRLLFQNKQHYRYKIIETLTAGIVLTGWETRSIFAHQFDLKDSYGVINSDYTCYLLNFRLTPVDKNPAFKHQLKHKLLLTTAQTRLWYAKKTQNNYTIIPLQLLLSNGKIKVVIALASGLKRHQKKTQAMEREWQKKTRHNFKKS